MMKILFVTAELFPFVKTGGLADYSEALPKALAKKSDADVRILIPGYPSLLRHLKKSKTILEVETILNPTHKITLIEGKLNGFPFPIFVIKAPKLYEREGSPYLDSAGNDWRDNFERFATLSMLPYLMIKNKISWIPDLIQINDWHTGLTPLYLRLLPTKSRPKTVFTIHNIAFQGNFSSRLFAKSGLPESLYEVNGVEFFNKLSFMKGGINFSDKVVTVSPKYATEITSTEKFGYGFSGILVAKGTNFTGILNGVDYNIWSPSKDKNLTYNYTKNTLENKEKQKYHLQKTTGLNTSKNTFLIGSVTRLSYQKGLDMAIEVLKQIIPLYPQIQYFCIGTGDKEQEEKLTDLAQKYPEQVCFFAKYDEQLAHQIIGSADAFLMPSRFEPCGLTQIYSLKYGTIPLVTPVGGLLDTIAPHTNTSKKITSTGFIADDVSQEAIQLMIIQAFEVFQNPPLWKKLMANAMKQNFNWKKSATSYTHIYKDLLQSVVASKP